MTLTDNLTKCGGRDEVSSGQTGSYLKPGATVWFTGLPCSGKTTIGNYLLKNLGDLGHRVELLDGDLLRHTISSGLGYSRDDREENIRRIAFIAGLLSKHGVITLVATISPYRSIRDKVREGIPNFIEVYVNAPLAVCEKRDVKGLYLKARNGELLHFTGISDPYEPPLNPEVVCYSDRETVEESVRKICEWLKRRNAM